MRYINLRRIIYPVLLIASVFPSAAWPAGVSVAIKSQPDSPLQVSAVDCNGKQSTVCTAKVRNASQGDLTAYGLVWRFVYAKGNFFLDHTTSDRTLVVQSPLHPGASAEEQNISSVSSASLVRVEVEVDFVIPSTGRAWGNANESSVPYQQVLAMRTGYKTALSHLRDIYNKEGVTGVRKALGIN
jgi:hypothetical protein